MAVRIQVRRDTSNNWNSANPVLAAGEIGYITDLRMAKIGNGSASFTELQFLVGGSEAEIIGLINSNTAAITTESQARASADAGLQSAISAESAARAEGDNELNGRVQVLEQNPGVPEGLQEQVDANSESIIGLTKNDEELVEALNGKLGLPQGELTELNINDWLIIGRTDPNTNSTPTYLSRLSTLSDQISGGGIEEAPMDGEQYARKDGKWEIVDVDAPLHLEFEWQGEEWWPDRVKEGEMFGHKSESSLFFSETDENGLNTKTIMQSIVKSGTTIFVTKTKDRSRWAHFTARSNINDQGTFMNVEVNLNAKSEKEIKEDDDVTVMFNVSAPSTIPEMIPAETVKELAETVGRMKKEMATLKGQVTRLKNGSSK